MKNLDPVNFVYSYRITYWGGTAPCYDGKGKDNYLSLAICKRDMRRVIGQEFLKKGETDKTFWILGIVGKGLQDKNKDFVRESIVYVAKVCDVIRFGDYFVQSESRKKRKDQIYKLDANGDYEDLGRHFSPTGEVHGCKFLWDRDWDQAHPNRPKFVLKCKEYAFCSKEQSDMIYSALADTPYSLAKYVGHTHFECGNETNIIKILENLVSSGNPHLENLPESVQNDCRYTCGKDKAL